MRIVWTEFAPWIMPVLNFSDWFYHATLDNRFTDSFKMSNDTFYGPDNFPKASESFIKANPHIFGAPGGGERAESKGSPSAADQFELKDEKALQKLIYLDLLRRGLYFHWQRTDKATTGTVGSPDFILPLYGHFVAIECKTLTGKPTDAQVKVGAAINRQGGDYWIVRSFNQYSEVLKKYT